jgi:hypothetical protein
MSVLVFPGLGGLQVVLLALGTYRNATTAAGRAATTSRTAATARASTTARGMAAGRAAAVVTVMATSVAFMVAVAIVIALVFGVIAEAKPGPRRMALVFTGKGRGCRSKQ